MLQRIRHHRRLGAAVLAVFVCAWLVALWANVQVRQALPAVDLAHLDVCFAAPAGGPAPHADPAAHDSHHADPGCLLCIALATPPALALAALRPPAPRVHPAQRSRAPAVAAWRAQAPLPPRGPPSTHA
ncbi:MAG: hypothetical protein DI574_06760 [Acidovorax sp.]|nr:MAG: hypothetical protein DI574_06760 [Acidovorax sp.]